MFLFEEDSIKINWVIIWVVLFPFYSFSCLADCHHSWVLNKVFSTWTIDPYCQSLPQSTHRTRIMVYILLEKEPTYKMLVQLVEKGEARYDGSRISFRAINWLKIQCSGPPAPCQICKFKETDCVFNEEIDHRRGSGLKRKIEELERYRDILLRVVEVIQVNKESQVNELLTTIRDGGSTNILNCIESALQHLGNTQRQNTEEMKSIRDEALLLFDLPDETTTPNELLTPPNTTTSFQFPSQILENNSSKVLKISDLVDRNCCPTFECPSHGISEP